MKNMNLLIFAVKDTKANAFMNPFYCRSLGEAVRAFSDETAKNESPFGRHPEDYNLFELGSFDQVHGVVTPLDAPKSIGTAANLKIIQ